MANFNLDRLYQEAFGLVSRRLPFSITRQEPIITPANAFDQEESNAARVRATGYLGTPIHLPCSLDNVQLPNEPLIEFSAQKRIVMTDIDGVDGSFKELYSNGDLQLVIRGVCVDEENPEEYPERQVRKLRTLLEKRKHIAITNYLAALWNVRHIAVESYSFPAVPGELGMQAYEIRALSDREFALNLRR